MKHIVIVGGGIAGLGAAYKLKRATETGEEITFTVIEKSDRLGGQLWTDRVVDEATGQAIIADGGSDSFLTEKPGIHRVAKMLGIFDEETGSCDEVKKTYIIKDGKLVEMPDGIMMFAPTKIIPMATTSLYSWPAKFRMACDLFIPKKRQPESGPVDESVESLVTRRLGREALDRLAEAIIGGVNGSDPATMSILATYPSLLNMEQEYGSLIMGFLAQRKKVEAIKKKYPPKPGAKRKTFFSSFEGGMSTIIDALVAAIGEENIRTGVGVTGIQQAGSQYGVTLEDGTTLEADGVIIAAQSWVASDIVRTTAPECSEILDTIPNSSCATIVLGFREQDAPFNKAWHGILTPAIEKRSVTGISLVSSKWPNRAPEGTVLLRGFVGGPRDPEIVHRSDEELVALVRDNFVELLGLSKGAQPTYSHVFRFPRSMPQYTVGHLDRMAHLNSHLTNHPGLALAGAPYKGVGVPNCLESGELATSKVLADFGIALEEDNQPEQRIW